MNINDKFKELKNPVLEKILRDTTVKCTAILSDNQEIMNYLDGSSKEITDPKQKALIEKLLTTRYNATADFISGINALHESLIKLDKCDSAYQTYLEKFFPNEVTKLTEENKETSTKEFQKVLDNNQRVEFQEQSVNEEEDPEKVVTTEQEAIPEEVSQEEVTEEVPVQEMPMEEQKEIPEEVEAVTPISEEIAVEVPIPAEEEIIPEQSAQQEEVIPEVAESAPQEVELPPVETTEVNPEVSTESPVPLQPLSPSVEIASPLPFPIEEKTPVKEMENQEINPTSVSEENSIRTYIKENTESAKGLIVTDKQLGNLKASKESQKELMEAAINTEQTPQVAESPEDILDRINELYKSGKTEEAQELSNKVLTKK